MAWRLRQDDPWAGKADGRSSFQRVERANLGMVEDNRSWLDSLARGLICGPVVDPWTVRGDTPTWPVISLQINVPAKYHAVSELACLPLNARLGPAVTRGCAVSIIIPLGSHARLAASPIMIKGPSCPCSPLSSSPRHVLHPRCSTSVPPAPPQAVTPRCHLNPKAGGWAISALSVVATCIDIFVDISTFFPFYHVCITHGPLKFLLFSNLDTHNRLRGSPDQRSSALSSPFSSARIQPVRVRSSEGCL